MPVYMLHGFRWPRTGFTGIRVYIVLHNLEEAAAEYLQQPLTSRLLLDSFKKGEPELMARIPELRFIEQYDPEDISTNAAVSQDFAYVANKVITLAENGKPQDPLGMDVSELVAQGTGLTPDASAAFTELRDKIAPGQKIGWFLVYNGDPERYYPEIDDESDYYDYTDEEDDGSLDTGEMVVEDKVETPASPGKSTSNRFKLTRLFGRKSNGSNNT